MHEITKTQRAKDDLKSIWHYSHKKWGENQATEYLLQLNAGIEVLARNPNLGKSRENIHPGYRSIQINRHVIFYSIEDQEIVVIRVLHERMLPGAHLCFYRKSGHFANKVFTFDHHQSTKSYHGL